MTQRKIREVGLSSADWLAGLIGTSVQRGPSNVALHGTSCYQQKPSEGWSKLLGSFFWVTAMGKSGIYWSWAQVIWDAMLLQVFDLFPWKVFLKYYIEIGVTCLPNSPNWSCIVLWILVMNISYELMQMSPQSYFITVPWPWKETVPSSSHTCFPSLTEPPLQPMATTNLLSVSSKGFCSK